MGNISDKSRRKNRNNTVQHLPSESRAVYAIPWAKMIGPDSPQMTI